MPKSTTMLLPLASEKSRLSGSLWYGNKLRLGKSQSDAVSAALVSKKASYTDYKCVPPHPTINFPLLHLSQLFFLALSLSMHVFMCVHLWLHVCEHVCEQTGVCCGAGQKMTL